MAKIKELLFWRFSLFAGLLALASIFIVSYFYYRVQADTPFAYWQVISNLSEYRALDSRVAMFAKDGSLDAASLRDNLLMQKDLIETTSQMIYILKEKDIATPPENGLGEIERSIAFRRKLLKLCAENGHCDFSEWSAARQMAWESCEKLLSDFNALVSHRESEWTKNLQRFYILSVMLLLSTLFFAAGRKR